MRTSFEVDKKGWPEAWQAVCRLLEEAIVPIQLQTWILPLEMVGSAPAGEGRLQIEMVAPNDFCASWVKAHFISQITMAFSQVTGSECSVEISVKEKGLGEQAPDPYEASADTVATVRAAETVFGGAPVVVRSSQDHPLEPRYTFDSFVVGASNQFAHASAAAVAEQPARQYNPLFIYSQPGLGKTHLLHAIGNYLIAKNPRARVAYLSAERFVNELIESVQHRRMPQFRAKYRDSYDMILIDDIQFLAEKKTSEEEFFHTFNALYSSKRQIVVTSDRAPKEIEGLEERVRTRFEWGLVADIKAPEIETRIAILKTKAERDDIYLPDDVATFLATHIKANVRELEGALVNLQAHASLTGAEISLEMARQQLRIAAPEEGSSVTIEAIQNAVSKHFHLRGHDLKSNTRARSVALPRQMAIYLIRKYTGLAYKDIGQHFGGKDHSTAMHACKKIEEGLESDESIREAVEAIQNAL